MKTTTKIITDVVLYVIIFILLQTFSLVAVNIWNHVVIEGGSMSSALEKASAVSSAKAMIATQMVSGIACIALFVSLKWYTLNTDYLQTRPLTVFFWIIILAFSLLFPSDWIQGKIGVEMPEESERMFSNIMKEPMGYLAIGLLAPFVEEIVFRGAILRSLFKIFPEGRHWWAIIISALIFAIIHGNMAQGLHAFLIGLLLGWMFYRTRSIVPGIIYHWANNSLVYLIYILADTGDKGQNEVFFSGNEITAMAAIALCLLVALYSISKMRKNIGFPPFEDR